MNKSLINLGLAIGLLTTAYHASSNDNPQTGVVFGIQGGYAEADVDIDNINTSDINNGNFYYGVTVGYDFAIEPAGDVTLGVETGVFYGKSISTVKHDGDETKVSNLIIPILGKVQFNTDIGLDFFAKGGVAYTKPSASKDHSDLNIDWNSDWSPAAAAGLGYQFGSLNVFVQYMHIFGSDETSQHGNGTTSKIDAVTIGLNLTL